MTSANAEGYSPLTRKKVQAYTEVSKTAIGSLEGGEGMREEMVSEAPDFSRYATDEELPEELREFISFFLDNMMSIAAEDPETLEELREKTVLLYKVMRDDIDENIWSLMEKKDADPESLEYLHSLITKSLDGIIYMLENNSFKELNKESKEQESLKYFKSMFLAMKKLLVMMHSGEISENEREEINKRLIVLENDTDAEPKDEEFEKVNKAII